MQRNIAIIKYKNTFASGLLPIKWCSHEKTDVLLPTGSVIVVYSHETFTLTLVHILGDTASTENAFFLHNLNARNGTLIYTHFLLKISLCVGKVPNVVGRRQFQLVFFYFLATLIKLALCFTVQLGYEACKTL